VELQFTALERRFVASGSPVYAFEAMRVAREHGREVPAWAWEYFDRVGAAVAELADKVRVTKRDMPPERLAQALEFNSPGRGTAWTKMLEVEEAIELSDYLSMVTTDVEVPREEGVLASEEVPASWWLLGFRLSGRRSKATSRRKALKQLLARSAPGIMTRDAAVRLDKRVDAAERRMNRILKPLRDFLGLDINSP